MLKGMRLEIEGKDTLHVCAHWKTFPPRGVGLGDTNPEVLRREGTLTEAEYSRYKIWERICGLKLMAPEKCLICEHLRKVIIKQGIAYIENPDGLRTPLVEKAVWEAAPQHRGHLVTNIRPGLATWVAQARGKVDGDR